VRQPLANRTYLVVEAVARALGVAGAGTSDEGVVRRVLRRGHGEGAGDRGGSDEEGGNGDHDETSECGVGELAGVRLDDSEGYPLRAFIRRGALRSTAPDGSPREVHGRFGSSHISTKWSAKEQ
jgi:hypothetical protein